MPDGKRGKVVNIGALVDQGRARVGSDRGEHEAPSPAEAPAPQSVSGRQEDRDPEPVIGSERAQASAPADQRQPPTATAAPASPAADQVLTAQEALYVRIPAHLKARLDDASKSLKPMKATNGEIIAAMIDQEVDASTPAGRGALTKRLERYRRAGAAS